MNKNSNTPIVVAGCVVVFCLIVIFGSNLVIKNKDYELNIKK